MGSNHPIRKAVPAAAPVIPDKLYFRIGDVARLCEVPAYVLRFWETEFPQLKPNKGGTGQRLYRKRDVEMALRIKSLLYDQGYTIPGARQVFKSEAKAKEATAMPGAAPEVTAAAAPIAMPAPAPVAEAKPATVEPISALRRNAQLGALRDDMRSLLAMLSAPVGETPAPESKVKPMRPRLISKQNEPERPRTQGDLFSFE